jgi:NinB protein
VSDRQVFVMAHDTARQMAVRAVTRAPVGYVVEVKPKTRTLDQNALLWGLLTDLSNQVNWHGQKLTPDEWKIVMTASIRRQRVLPGIDGGFVAIGESTSKMTVKEFSDLVELIHAFGAQHEVRFSGSEE